MKNIQLIAILFTFFHWAQFADSMEPVSVGHTVSLSGRYAEFGQSRLRGLQMWVDDVNDRGGLLGRPVKLVTYDDHSSREVCATFYEQLIAIDNVDLLIGPYSSEMTLAARLVVEKYGMPMVVEGTAPEIWQDGANNLFGILTPAEKSMDAVLELVAQNGLKRLAIVYAGTDYPRGVARGVRARSAELGLELVADKEYHKDFKQGRDFRKLIEELKVIRPDAVLVAGYYLDSLAFLREARTQEFAPGIIAFSSGPALQKFGDELGAEYVEGVISAAQWVPGQRMPGAFDFSLRFKRRYNQEVDYNAAAGYASGQITESAARLARTTDNDGVREQLSSMKFLSLLGRYRVDENGKQVGKPNYVIQWRGGQRHLILPSNLARSGLLYPFPSWGAR